ncbi:unnamed protein product [Lepeophtheirus salmonis]|uniref:(salmon louse) hypothetical protein n=1 Tax=Lepeophtheirus salmonis TaxID=72036 RepID=A0A7R8CAN9_LEPSM|nr:unnamed protein product [Lepeophtheirus salmonis]CAF2751535.1 unnamed protein product [Lepeophtheirus salmonis]
MYSFSSFISLLILLCTINELDATANDVVEDKKDEKLLSIFNVVTFPNTFCTGSASKNGTCYTADECETRGGTASGSCASGYGVCCVITLSCGGTSSDNCTYIEQSSFTSTSSLNSNPCTYTICKNSNMICRIRLDFTTFTIANPFTTPVGADAAGTTITNAGATGDCVTDSFSFTSPGSRGSPVICGANSGQHTTSRSWIIKATQYTCGDYDSLGGPPGCLQYFTGTTGKISSFNYPTSETTTTTSSSHLSNQCYSICFRQEATKCSICFASAIAGQNTFGLSVSPNAAAKSAVDSECTSDYLQIPNGVAKGAAAAAVATTQKFCGRILNLERNLAAETSVCSFSLPFRVDFKTDADEVCTANTDATTCEASLPPGGSIGFFLAFEQIPCA